MFLQEKCPFLKVSLSIYLSQNSWTLLIHIYMYGDIISRYSYLVVMNKISCILASRTYVVTHVSPLSPSLPP